MNDDELREFLDAATVDDDDAQQDEAARPRSGGQSFDELIGRRRRAAQTGADVDEPLVLPDPPGQSRGAEPHAPVFLPPQLAETPPPPSEPPAATQPLSRDEWAAATEPPDEEKPRAPREESPATAPVAAVPAFGTPLFAPEPEASGSGDGSGRGYEPIEVTGGSGGGARFLPWIIVGAVAAVALVASVFIVGALGANSEPEPTAAPTTSPTESPDPAPEPAPAPEEPDEPAPAPGDEPPQVDVGSTMVLNIPQWGVTADLSSRFGQTSYVIDAEQRLVLTSATINALPESCAAMRQQWGVQRLEDGSFAVLKPEERCAEAPEVWDELWGLTAAMVESIRPLEG